jgi:hypothetical protein
MSTRNKRQQPQQPQQPEQQEQLQQQPPAADANVDIAAANTATAADTATATAAPAPQPQPQQLPDFQEVLIAKMCHTYQQGHRWLAIFEVCAAMILQLLSLAEDFSGKHAVLLRFAT